jgi:hypothetical protein
MKVHWAGGASTKTTEWLRGWPCCCSGKAAYRIRARGNLTGFPDMVTCKRCIATMERARPSPLRPK